MEMLQGLAVSGGIVEGNALVVPLVITTPVERHAVTKGEQDRGWKRFQAARQRVKKSLGAILESSDTKEEEVNDIFQTHLLMLSDEVFIADLRINYIKSGYNIEFVLDEYVKNFAATLRNADVALLAERSWDILDVFGQVMDVMRGLSRFDFSAINAGVILVAASLEATSLLTAVKRGIGGLVLAEGGAASHGAIIARAYGIPALFQVRDEALMDGTIASGTPLIVDAASSRLYVRPDEATRTLLREKAQTEERLKKDLERFLDKPCVTKDGVLLDLFANIGSAEEAVTAIKDGAAGVGLFRSEFLFMEAGAALSEETQFRCYRQVLETMQGKPVVIRTLDAGGDKVVEAINAALGDKKQHPVMTEKNPLLGQRAIRLCLSAIEVFTTQLRALLRAGVYGDLRIMFPLVTRLEEITGSLRLLDSIKRGLEKEGLPFKRDLKCGVMIETPAAALISGSLAAYCDFFSIGTNDLTQYTLAIDRENPAVARYFNEFHPAVIDLIKMTVKSAVDHNIPVSVCGEMAGSSQGARVLAGMGIRRLSVSSHRIAPLKAMFADLTQEDLKRPFRSVHPAVRIEEK